MDWFLFWDCLAVIGAIVVHRWAAIAVARYADGDPSRAPSVATLVARSAEGLGHAIRRRFGGNAMSLRLAGLSVLGALVLGGGFFGLALRSWRWPTAQATRALFLYSIPYLGLLFVAMGFDQTLPW